MYKKIQCKKGTFCLNFRLTALESSGDVESGDYKLQAASLTNDQTNASKTKTSLSPSLHHFLFGFNF